MRKMGLTEAQEKFNHSHFGNEYPTDAEGETICWVRDRAEDGTLHEYPVRVVPDEEAA